MTARDLRNAVATIATPFAGRTETLRVSPSARVPSLSGLLLLLTRP